MRGRVQVCSASAILAVSLVAASCVPAPRPWPSPDEAAYTRSRAELDARREARPATPWAVGIHVLVREPRSGRTLEGRGAIAAAPGRAVRMILTGGAGSTMLDAWVSPDRYRVAIPAIDQVRRGGDAEATDLPVGFLRWWFLAPLSGRLFAAADEVWLLRADQAVVELRTAPCDRGEGLLATRRTRSRDERVLECRAQVGQVSVGDSAEYDDRVSGLHVRVDVESVAQAPPDERAFLDPDTAGAAP
jgi:hypothetical protein